MECVECGGDVPVTSPKRPLLITCPSCGTKGVVEDDDEGGDEEPETVDCVECGGPVPVTSPKRPLLITCPKCGTKGVVE